MENIDFINLGLKAMLGTIAVILYAVWAVRKYLNEFEMNKFVNHNKKFWVWSLIMLYSVLLIVTVHPPAAEAFKTLIGLDVNGEPTSFLMLGWGLSAMVNGLNSKKLNTKNAP